jgi:serine/threonine protein kinase
MNATPKAEMLTTDLELTADLDDTELPDPDAAEAAVDHIPDDVPFHDEVHSAPRAQRMPVAPGRILCDRFVLTKLLGTGGMCSVYLARDLEAERVRDLPTFVALKTPRPGYKDPARAIERLKREFEHAKRLSHTGIVQVFELANEGDVWFMTMELLEGESVASIMRRQPGALAPYLIRRVLRGAAEALAYAHVAGIAHGDLNPANIFLMTGDRVKLLDFGAACTPDQPPSAAAAIAYASPQVLEGETPVIRDDVFSLGCIAYQMLTGHHPFEQRSAIAARADAARPATPDGLTNEQSLALMAALSWDRDGRPDDVRSLAATLAPPEQRRRAPIEPEIFIPPPLPQNDVRWWLFGAACVVAGIAAVVMTRLA